MAGLTKPSVGLPFAIARSFISAVKPAQSGVAQLVPPAIQSSPSARM
jgi:hypothetical protein